MAVEVTDEMRKAVYEADCERLGHMPEFNRAVTNTPTSAADWYVPDVGGPDPDTMAHIYCRRCGHVWLVIEDPGADYADAVAKLKGRVKDPESVKPRPRKAQAHQH